MNSFSLYEPDLRSKAYHPQIVAYYYKQWDDFRMAFHSHQAVEIMYVISGKCMVELDDTLLSLKKGDFILLDAGVRHRLIVEHDGPCRMLNVEFIFIEATHHFPSIKNLALQEASLDTLLTSEKPYFVLRDPHDVYHTLKSLVIEMDDAKSNDEPMVQLLLAQLLIRISRTFAMEGDGLSKLSDVYVRQTLEYMHQFYDCDIQVKDIAAAVSLHPGYLHRIFKHSMHCSIVEYLTSLRIEKAKMLLSHTDIPIIEIADYVGINSRQYLSSIFKKHTGKSPVAYRNSAERVQWGNQTKS